MNIELPELSRINQILPNILNRPLNLTSAPKNVVHFKSGQKRNTNNQLVTFTKDESESWYKNFCSKNDFKQVGQKYPNMLDVFFKVISKYVSDLWTVSIHFVRPYEMVYLTVECKQLRNILSHKPKVSGSLVFVNIRNKLQLFCRIASVRYSTNLQ